MGNWFQNFMIGRNGFDRLCTVQILLALVLNLLGRLLRLDLLVLLSTALSLWAVFRAMSRNIPRRQQENTRFLTAGSRIRSDVRARRERHSHRKEFKFFRCPGCGNWLRVPRNKGKIQITCPRCGHRFSGST